MKGRELNVNKIAARIAYLIEDNLGHWRLRKAWDEVDPEVRVDIRKQWREIVREAIAANKEVLAK